MDTKINQPESKPEQLKVPTAPPEHDDSFLKKNFWVISGIGLATVFSLTTSFLLLSTKNTPGFTNAFSQTQPQQLLPNLQKTPDKTAQRIATTKLTPTTSIPLSLPTKTSSQSGSWTVPPDWKYVISDTCKVMFATPPKNLPYYYSYKPHSTPSISRDEGSGRFWQFQEYPGSDFFFTKTAEVIHKNDTDSSAFVSGVVRVVCSNNTTNDTAQSLATKLENTISASPSAGITIRGTQKAKKWGRDVVIMNINGKEYKNREYFLVTSKSKIYFIYRFSESDSTFVKETADNIVSAIQFLE